MHKKNINKIFQYVVLVLFISGCSTPQEKCCLMLPNGNFLEGSTVNDLNSFYDLTYEHYQGFTGVMKTENPMLSKFTIQFENQSQKVGNDVASDDYIEVLKSENYIGLRFDKIPDSEMSYQTILSYIVKHYPNLKKEKTQEELEIGIDKEVVFLNQKNEIIVKVQYSKLGISGTFVSLDCSSCN